MAEEGESKVQAVKRLALSGKFEECERLFGAKAAAKAREYVQGKITARMEAAAAGEVGDDSSVSGFVKFCLINASLNLDEAAASFSLKGCDSAVETGHVPEPPEQVNSQAATGTESIAYNTVAADVEAMAVVEDTESITAQRQPCPGEEVGDSEGHVELEPTHDQQEEQKDVTNDEGMGPSSPLKRNSGVAAGKDADPTPKKAKSTNGPDANVKVTSKPRAPAKSKSHSIPGIGSLCKPPSQHKKSKSTKSTKLDKLESLSKGGLGGKCSAGPKKVYVPVENYRALSDKEFERLINKPMDRGETRKVHGTAASASMKAAVALSAPKVHSGIKQKELPSSLDLLNMAAKPRRVGQFPADTVVGGASPGVGVSKSFALLLAPYREFLSQLPAGILPVPIVSRAEAICSASQTAITVKLTACEELVSGTDGGQSGGVWMLTVLDRHGAEFGVLYVAATNPLLSADVFLVERSVYTASVDEPFVVTSAPVRKLFAVDSTGTTGAGEWVEGTVYHIREDFRQNPYNSVSVVWLQQEQGTNAWVYEYSQTDNSCSPWDLQLSEYYLLKNVKDATLPKSLSVGVPTPAALLAYINSLDCTDGFKIPVRENKEFCKMFPSNANRLDLGVIREWCRAGRYGDDTGTGLALLFEDLSLMIRNAKQFNGANTYFLPWRLCDVFEKTMLNVKKMLILTHKKINISLESSSCVSPALPPQVSEGQPSHKTPSKSRGREETTGSDAVPAQLQSTIARPKKPFAMAAVTPKPAGSTGPILACTPPGDMDTEPSPATLQINMELGLEPANPKRAAAALCSGSVLLGSQFSQDESQESQSQPCSQVVDM